MTTANITKGDILMYLIQDMNRLTEIAKGDYDTTDAQIEAMRLKQKLMMDSCICEESYGDELKLIGRVDSLIHGGWLFEYLGRGYILRDIGNCHYTYCCKAEDLLLSLVVDYK